MFLLAGTWVIGYCWIVAWTE